MGNLNNNCGSLTNFSLDDLLIKMLESRASDLHLAIGSPPCIRIDGALVQMKEYSSLTNDMLENILYYSLTDHQKEEFQNKKELDFSYSIPKLCRFRGNMFYQRNTISAVFRAIPSRPLTLEELRLPPIIKKFCDLPRGLVLVTGPTGSGKSTTLASMVDYINRNRAENIITIEDPIEFLHKSQMSLVRQRELGNDTLSFSEALKHVLRQDPNVILVGEMRDLETIALAVTAAETGHLVLATLHTTSASSTIDRIIDVFPSGQQQQIKMQLSTTLEGVVCQTLIHKKDTKGRVCAMEIMVGVTGIRNLIREGKTFLIGSMIQSGQKEGMQSLNMSLKKLVQDKIISLEDAIQKSSDPEDLKDLLSCNPAK